MNYIEISPQQLAEDLRMMAGFRAAGLSEYDACMLTAEIKQAAA